MPTQASIPTVISGRPDPVKVKHIQGTIFHVFIFPDGHSSSIYDYYMDFPIVYGDNAIVKGFIKNLNQFLSPTIKIITIFYYQYSSQLGYKLIFQFKGDPSNTKIPTF